MEKAAQRFQKEDNPRWHIMLTLGRADNALEQGQWDKAQAYFEDALKQSRKQSITQMAEWAAKGLDDVQLARTRAGR